MSEPTETIADEAARLLKDITPGEWSLSEPYENDYGFTSIEVGPYPLEGRDGFVEDALCLVESAGNGGYTPANAAFIAASPRLVRELLKSHEALLAALKDAEEILRNMLGSDCEPDCECVLHKVWAALSLAEAGDR